MAHKSKNEKGVQTWSKTLEKMFAKIGLVLVGNPVGDPVWERLENGLRETVFKPFWNSSGTVQTLLFKRPSSGFITI